MKKQSERNFVNLFSRGCPVTIECRGEREPGGGRGRKRGATIGQLQVAKKGILSILQGDATESQGKDTLKGRRGGPKREFSGLRYEAKDVSGP